MVETKVNTVQEDAPVDLAQHGTPGPHRLFGQLILEAVVSV